MTQTVQILQEKGIAVSLFIDPETAQIDATAATGARFVELHTGRYADAPSEERIEIELVALRKAAAYAAQAGLRVNAGHGLRLQNVRPVASIPEIEELSIGHAIVARSIYVGMEAAVKEMLEALRE